MTKQELRELDMLIAEKVMGWKRGKAFGNGNGEWLRPDQADINEWQRSTWDGTPLYSTHIGAAWQVVEAMQQRGITLILEDGRCGREGLPQVWTARFVRPDRVTDFVSAASATLVICRAAIQALE